MLVLTRKLGEEILIDGNITIRVVDCGRNRVRLAIDAPPSVRILREELAKRVEPAFIAEQVDLSTTEFIAPLTPC